MSMSVAHFVVLSIQKLRVFKSLKINSFALANICSGFIRRAMVSQVALWLVPGNGQNVTKQNVVTFFETFLPAAPECIKLVPVQPVHIPSAVTEDETKRDGNVLAACLRESLRFKKRIAYASDPDGSGTPVSFETLKMVRLLRGLGCLIQMEMVVDWC